MTVFDPLLSIRSVTVIVPDACCLPTQRSMALWARSTVSVCPGFSPLDAVRVSDWVVEEDAPAAFGVVPGRPVDSPCGASTVVHPARAHAKTRGSEARDSGATSCAFDPIARITFL